jgi:hypothetical protein
MTFTPGRGYSTTIRATRCAAGGPGCGVTDGPESSSTDAASQAPKAVAGRVQPGRLPPGWRFVAQVVAHRRVSIFTPPRLPRRRRILASGRPV